MMSNECECWVLVENVINWGNTRVPGEKTVQCHFGYHQSHIDRSSSNLKLRDDNLNLRIWRNNNDRRERREISVEMKYVKLWEGYDLHAASVLK